MKDVQRLTRRIAAFSCFISKSSERCHLFFNTLHKSKSFEWTPTCEEAINQLKRYLTSPLLFSKPKDGETLYIYLAVSETTVSVVLIRKEEGKQLPVYYVSRALLDTETRYTELKKLALALVIAAKKLRLYFQCHPIIVLTTFPLNTILHKPELPGRLTKWAVELNEFNITFLPQTAIKSQVLVDFIVDFTPNIHEQAKKELFCMTEGAQLGMWTLHVDGLRNFKGCGLGMVLTYLDGDVLERSISYGFKATNNEAEYEAIIACLNLAKEMGVQRLTVCSNSQLVINQMQGHYQARDNKMIAYLDIVKTLTASFQE